jgi:hypothetical protein
VSSQVLRPAGRANAPRWDGESRGHYEVWYLTLSHPGSARGFWFRYTLEVPSDPGREPVAERWGFVFTPGEPAAGGKETCALEWPPKGVMHVGDAVLEDGHAVGEVTGAGVGMAWDLRWEPSPTAMWPIPGWLGRSKVPSTRVVSPSLRARFDGTVRVGDRTFELRGAPGCQTHLWGRQHAARWAWAHCSAFAEDDGAVLEAVHAVPLLGRGRPAPRGATFLYAEVGGDVLACNAWPWVARASSRVESPRWELRGRTRTARVRAVVEADLAEMAQVTYEDPDGEKAWCCNSEIGRCALEVERDDGSFVRLTSDGLAHVEFGAREPDPRVPILA